MTDRDWHNVCMTTDDLAALGRRLEKARLDKGWGKERAAREADISAITWKRIEDGLGVQDAKRAAALRVLGLDSSGYSIEEAQGTGLDPETVAVIRQAVSEEVERRLASQPGEQP